MRKSADAFRTISEVAQDLDLPQHVLRFWETRFSQIKPMKRGGGRRYYRPDDVALLSGIRHLLYDQGYTIKGVQKILKEQGVEFVIATLDEEGNPAPQESGGNEPPKGAVATTPEDAVNHEAVSPEEKTTRPQPQTIATQHSAMREPAPVMTQPTASVGQGPAAPYGQSSQPGGVSPEAMPHEGHAEEQTLHPRETEGVSKTIAFRGATRRADPSVNAPQQALTRGFVGAGVSARSTSHVAQVREVSAEAPHVGAETGIPVEQQIQSQPVLDEEGQVLPEGLRAGTPEFLNAGKSATVSIEEARLRALQEEQKTGFLSRFMGSKVDPNNEPSQAMMQESLSRDEVRRLQSTLFELLECKRILDQALSGEK